MSSIWTKDNETGNWIKIEYSKNNVIIETENDKAEIKGKFNKFHELMTNTDKERFENIRISEETAFGKVLELINEKYKNLKIIYTVKYDENTVLDVIHDFSKVVSKDTQFEIHCTGGIDWIAKVNNLLIYGNVNGNIAFKKINKENVFEKTEFHFPSKFATISEINDLVDEFNDIQHTFKLI